MFLLFSCAAAGGTLLEEEENGTLDRLIGSRAGMGGMLFGKWLFIAIVGVVQLTVMFVWGALMFRLPLWTHLPGFFVMTVITAAAAAGFGLVLATLSRTRAQLSGISTIVILTMSAIGGSMFPRFLMSETMQTLRARHVQFVGARRLLESVLAGGAGGRAVAAGARARGADRHLPWHLAGACQTMGIGKNEGTEKS